MPKPTKQQRLELEELDNRRKQILELNKQERGLNTRTMQTQLYSLSAFLKKASENIDATKSDKMAALKEQLSSISESFSKIRDPKTLEKDNYDFVSAIRGITSLNDLMMKRDDDGKLYFDIIEEKGKGFDGEANYDRNSIFDSMRSVDRVLNTGLSDMPEEIKAEQGEEKQRIYRESQGLRSFVADPSAQFVGTLMTNSPHYSNLGSLIFDVNSALRENKAGDALPYWQRLKRHAYELKYQVDKARKTTSPSERRRMLIGATQSFKSISEVRKQMDNSGIKGINANFGDFGKSVELTDYANGQDVISRFFPTDDERVVKQFNLRTALPEPSIAPPNDNISNVLIVNLLAFSNYKVNTGADNQGSSQPWNRLYGYAMDLDSFVEQLSDNDPRKEPFGKVNKAVSNLALRVNSFRNYSTNNTLTSAVEAYDEARRSLEEFNQKYPQYKNEMAQIGGSFFRQWPIQDFAAHRHNIFNITDKALKYDPDKAVNPFPDFEQDRPDEAVKSYDDEQKALYLDDRAIEDASKYAAINFGTYAKRNEQSFNSIFTGFKADFDKEAAKIGAISQKGEGMYGYQHDTEREAKQLARDCNTLPNLMQDVHLTNGRAGEDASTTVKTRIQSIINKCKEYYNKRTDGEPAEGQDPEFYYPASFRKTCKNVFTKLEKYMEKHYVVDPEHPFEDFIMKNSGSNAQGRRAEAMSNVVAAYQWKLANQNLPDDRKKPFNRNEIQKAGKEVLKDPIFRDFFKAGPGETGMDLSDGLSDMRLNIYSTDHRFMQVIGHMNNPFAHRITMEQQREALKGLMELGKVLDTCEGASADYKDFFHTLKDLKNKNIRTMDSQEMARTLKNCYDKTEKFMKGRKRNRRWAEQREHFEQALDALAVLSKAGNYGKALADKLVNRTNVVRGHWLQSKVSLEGRSTEKTKNRLEKLRGVQKTLKANDEIRAKEREIHKKHYVKASEIDKVEDLPELPDDITDTVKVDDLKDEIEETMNSADASYGKVNNTVSQMLAFSTTPVFRNKSGQAVMAGKQFADSVNVMSQHECTTKISEEMAKQNARGQLMDKENPYKEIRQNFDAKNEQLRQKLDNEEREVLGAAYGLSDEQCREILKKRRELRKAQLDAPEDDIEQEGLQNEAGEEKNKEEEEKDDLNSSVDENESEIDDEQLQMSI
ncbi:MAG: hypothetical protein IKN24_02780 [Lachnospiraceae bacterium]|nr:hypothetical protein [Lachnospiraceae bacterium]